MGPVAGSLLEFSNLVNFDHGMSPSPCKKKTSSHFIAFALPAQASLLTPICSPIPAARMPDRRRRYFAFEPATTCWLKNTQSRHNCP